jgi:hypothetical protein
MSLETIKLEITTSSGRPIRLPAVIERRDGRIFFVKSDYKLRHEIKAMKGSKWHGYDEENPLKQWSIDDCQRNNFQLDILQGKVAYVWFDRELIRHVYRNLTRAGKPEELMPHQVDMADSGLTYHYQIWAAEMGCVDGDAIVHVNRAGKGFTIKLSDLYFKFNGGHTRGRVWDLSVPTYIRSLCGKSLRLNRVWKVLAKGRKPVVRLLLASGKCIRVTADHEICVDYDLFIRADNLVAGGFVLTNGLIVDKDGYVRVHGIRHHRETTGGIYEHILVAEKMLGRDIFQDEVVHHKNGVKHDNRPENLEVLLKGASEHAALHGKIDTYRNMDGGRSSKGGLVCFVPKFDTIVSVTPDGETDVYDIICDDPHHNFVANGIIVHNCGKTLSAQMVIENSGIAEWYWVGPKTSLPNIQREFRLWGFPSHKFNVQFFTYEGLKTLVDSWPKGQLPPQGLICDECSRLKTSTSQRSHAVQKLADMIRAQWGYAGFVIEMSGTPAPKTPVDWWSPAEIAWPGFLREGSPKTLEQRLAFMVDQEFDTAKFKKRVGWKDDERKCDVCGAFREIGPHTLDGITNPDEYHPFKPSKNEVSYLYERLNGLVVVKHLKDCIALPEKRYRRIVCKPTASTLRTAQALAASAPNAITGMTLMRELSDGFIYVKGVDGKTKCTLCKDGTVDEWYLPDEEDRVFQDITLLPDDVIERLLKRTITCPSCGGSGEMDKIVRNTREVPCPKEPALKMLLDECEERGRIVIFAGFTGSVDRICRLILKEKWDVVRCDEGNFQILTQNGSFVEEEPLDFWADLERHQHVAFVANPESGGMSLTLTESRMAVYWSNTWKPEFRIQSEGRVHRKGMDLNLGCEIVDLIHLPTDQRVLDVIKDNRKLELMTMGEILEGVDWNDAATEEGQFEEYRT